MMIEDDQTVNFGDQEKYVLSIDFMLFFTNHPHRKA